MSGFLFIGTQYMNYFCVKILNYAFSYLIWTPTNLTIHHTIIR